MGCTVLRTTNRSLKPCRIAVVVHAGAECNKNDKTGRAGAPDNDNIRPLIGAPKTPLLQALIQGLTAVGAKADLLIASEGQVGARPVRRTMKQVPRRHWLGAWGN